MSEMSYGSTKRSGSSASRRSLDGDTPEEGGEDRDESKRRSRNLSEKKRRDQFNVLINELCSMVATSPRKMDKSTVLKATIAFLKAHNELSLQSQVQETQENWKPSFLSNEEFTHLMLEALDGFIAVISDSGNMVYLSESIISLLGYLPSDLVNNSVYDYIPAEERSEFHNVLTSGNEGNSSNVSVVTNFRLGGLEMNEENQKYQLVRFGGYFKRWVPPSNTATTGSETGTEKSEDDQESTDSKGSSHVFVTTGRLLDSDLLREMSIVVDNEKNEFCSRHSMEWKFLFLDHRAPPIIGYLPFEVLGTSGYDYYHVDDLEKVATCHEALMHKGEGTSCYYRFLTKGQQWIWIQTRYYITYHQWNSKPEFIMCTHRVVSCADVMKELRMSNSTKDGAHGPTTAKQPKIEPGRNHSPCLTLKSTNRQKNENLSYGTFASNRSGALRKLDLPPKFATELHASSSHVHGHPLGSNISPGTEMCSPHSSGSNMTVHTSVGTQFVLPTQLPSIASPSLLHVASTADPILSFPSSSVLMPHSQSYGLTKNNSTHLQPASFPDTGNSNHVNRTMGHSNEIEARKSLQSQLLIKHSELQRQIFNKQEELRKISEQLHVAQCGHTLMHGPLTGDESSVVHGNSSRRHHHPLNPVQQPHMLHSDPNQTMYLQYEAQQQEYALRHSGASGQGPSNPTTQTQ